MTPFQLGQAAFKNGIKAACKDQAMMDWISKNTSGEVGSAVEPLKLWIDGFHFELNSEMKKQFPEMYT